MLDKSCHRDFNYSEHVCQNLLNNTYQTENTAVQNEIAQFKVFYN